ncbi:MAG: pyridoxal phosphate-dependent aminotransferase [Pseudomonadales bacterium]|nr:pyridoxal phosphate-dependent aminotransferase [Pseudomonadales bacterium]
MTGGPFAERLARIESFRVMKLLARANALEEAGHDVIHMEVGEPDFPTPEPIVRAGQVALAAGKTRYTPALGITPLREAIAGFYSDAMGVEVNPRRVIVTAGGSGGLLLTCALLFNPGDKLMMTDPAYPCNRHFLATLSAAAQLVPVDADEGYQLTAARVRSAWEETTRGVLLATPANPTGATVPDDELVAIARAVHERSGHLIVDEIYQGLVYGERPFSTVLGVDDEAFVINSFSKYFGMTGWRIGWIVVPEAAVDEIEKLAQNLFICPSSIAQHAALAGFSPAAREIMERQREALLQRRDYTVAALMQMGFGVPRVPDGAFYVYARLPDGLAPAEAFCDWLLETHFVAVTPGNDFGEFQASEHIRVSYAQSMPRLEMAMERLARAVRERR